MNLSACFEEFLADHVNLNQPRIDQLVDRVNTIGAFLKRAERLGCDLLNMIPQGSFAQRTIIKPPEEGDTFDADVLVHMPFEGSQQPADYVPRLAAAFEGSGRYENKIDPGKRGVTLDYANEFHIDLVPFVMAANGQYITNCEKDPGWEKTNPEGFNAWLAERDSIAHGRLVEVIRLSKYLRECSDVEFAAPSVTLTLLLGEMVTQEAANSGAYVDLPTAFVSLIRCLDGFLWDNEDRPDLPDPTCDEQNFHDRWDAADYTRCRSAIHDLVSLIDEALEAPNDDMQLKAWQAIFGAGFVVPADLAESEAGRTGEEFIDTKYNFDIRLTEDVTIDGEVIASGPNVGYSLGDRKNQVDPHRRIEFTYQTTAPMLNHRVFWKAKNSGEEAAKSGCYRGEIREGSPGTSHGEPTRYRGQHSMEVFIVVGNVCVARTTRQVHIV